MNQRIAKKIEALTYGAVRSRRCRRSRFEQYYRYTCAQRHAAGRVDNRRLKRKAAAVRAKRGWSQRPDPYGA